MITRPALDGSTRDLRNPRFHDKRGLSPRLINGGRHRGNRSIVRQQGKARTPAATHLGRHPKPRPQQRQQGRQRDEFCTDHVGHVVAQKFFRLRPGSVHPRSQPRLRLRRRKVTRRRRRHAAKGPRSRNPETRFEEQHPPAVQTGRHLSRQSFHALPASAHDHGSARQKKRAVRTERGRDFHQSF